MFFDPACVSHLAYHHVDVLVDRTHGKGAAFAVPLPVPTWLSGMSWCTMQRSE